ncbi:MAG: energy transducer TonB [Algicola sp.]|nr:energy transducer TonB [Algicola sp.]
MKFKLLLLSSLLSTAVYAEQSVPSSKLLESIVPAKAIKRVEPKYPDSAIRRGHEGWVKLSYVIEPDGSVSNAFVVDSSGLRSFERSTLKAIKKWKFSPALDKNGNAIQQCVNSIQMDYSIGRDGKPPGATRKFRSKYKDILEAFDTKDFAKAGQYLDELGESKKFTLFEDKLYWKLKGYYHQYLGDDRNALTNFKRSAYRISDVADESYLTILDTVFVLELKQNLLADALETYATIEKAPNNQKTLERLKPYQQKITALIESEEVISVAATIGERGFAQYKLARSQFELSHINGKVDKVKVYCDNKQNTFSYATDSSWTIPESWGSCSLYVYGRKDTAFNIVELPKNI